MAFHGRIIFLDPGGWVAPVHTADHSKADGYWSVIDTLTNVPSILCHRKTRATTQMWVFTLKLIKMN